jgi:hypothetical protein
MKLIPNDEIFGKICTLISTAKKEVIIVSPYNDLKGWSKLNNVIKKTQKNSVKIHWYVRGNNVNRKNEEDVRSLGIEPILVDHLHAKIYLNEEIAIVASMNMSQVSFAQSIEIGYLTENKEERDEVYEYFNTYIKTAERKTSTYSPNGSFNRITESEKKTHAFNISEFFYVNGIYEHICRNYGEPDFEIKIKREYTENDKRTLDYLTLKRDGYMISFEPYERNVSAIKIYFSPSNEQRKKKISESLIKSGRNKLVFSNELDYNEKENLIKYYYVSNVKITNWKRSQLDIFLKDFDTIMEIVQ